jgi:predicted PhzF superfamily epimerase YddE/YHI9
LTGAARGATLHVLRVFCAADGTGGNAAGVFLDGSRVPPDRRQAVAHELGFAETVFVDDGEHGEVRIFTPDVEFQFAGHPVVGTAWLLREAGVAVDVLRPPAGEVEVRFDGELTHVTADPDWGPKFEFIEADNPGDVDGLERPPIADHNCAAWAWIDERAGLIRARVFVPEGGIAEDEATGSAALRLTARLGREIEINQGRGSILRARPLGPDRAEVGGRVVLDGVRRL